MKRTLNAILVGVIFGLFALGIFKIPLWAAGLITLFVGVFQFFFPLGIGGNKKEE